MMRRIVGIVSVFLWHLAVVADAQLPCSICEDSSLRVPGKLKDVVARITGGIPTTCGSLESSAPLLAAGSFECESIRISAMGLCGCPFSQVPPPGKCQLCESGDLLTDEQLDIVAQASPDGKFLQPCRLFAIASQLQNAGTEGCADYHATGLAYCGCPDPPGREGNVCTFCSNGNLISVNQRRKVLNPEEGLTCALLAGTAAKLNADAEQCTQFRAWGNLHCGCVQTTGEVCPLCADGQALSGKQRDLLVGGLSETTCGDLEKEAALFYDRGEDMCKMVQATAGGPLCQCSPASTSSDNQICRICGDGTPLPDPSRRVELPEFFGVDRKEQCGYVEYFMNVVRPEDCSLSPLRRAAAPLCCFAEPTKSPTINVIDDDDDYITRNDPDCQDLKPSQTVKIFEPDEVRDCPWLDKQAKSVRKFHCKTFNPVKKACRDTCGECKKLKKKGKEDKDCGDDNSAKFRSFRQLEQSCVWLSRRDNEKRRRLCDVSPKAKKKCPVACGECF